MIKTHWTTYTHEGRKHLVIWKQLFSKCWNVVDTEVSA